MGALPVHRPGRERRPTWIEEVLADVARTLDDLAALSGVSRSTVSRVINGGPSSERARRRVLAADTDDRADKRHNWQQCNYHAPFHWTLSIAHGFGLPRASLRNSGISANRNVV